MLVSHIVPRAGARSRFSGLFGKIYCFPHRKNCERGFLLTKIGED